MVIYGGGDENDFGLAEFGTHCCDPGNDRRDGDVHGRQRRWSLGQIRFNDEVFGESYGLSDGFHSGQWRGFLKNDGFGLSR